MFKKNKVKSKSPRYAYEYSMTRNGWMPNEMVLDTEYLGRIRFNWLDRSVASVDRNGGSASLDLGSVELHIHYKVRGRAPGEGIIDWHLIMRYKSPKRDIKEERTFKQFTDDTFTLRDWTNFTDNLAKLVDRMWLDIFESLGDPNIVSNSKKKKRGSSTEVAYIRHGTNTIHKQLYGGGQELEKQRTVWVTTTNGEKYEIPVDENGNVPKEAILQRFLDESKGGTKGNPRDIYRDITQDAEIMHDIGDGITPEQIIQTGWWQHPNGSDIEGIDDSNAQYYREIPNAAKSAKHIGKKIAIMTPHSRAMEIRRVLGSNFTASELKEAVRDGGIVITEGKMDPGVAGYYRGKVDGTDTPVIKILPRAGADTITHEFVHHMRRVDESRGGLARTPFKLKEGKVLDLEWVKTGEYDSASNLEEATTVAETTARTRSRTAIPTGYYAATRSPEGRTTPKARYDHDRDILVGVKGSEKPLKGKRAIRKVEKEFDNLDISTLRAKSHGKQANTYLADRKEKGDLPIAKKKDKSKSRAKKKDADYSKPVSGPVGVTANRKSYRRKR